MLNHWQTHKDRLRGYIGKRIDTPAAIDDILQEVYLKAHTHLHQLRDSTSLNGWLYRIAHNAIMDHHRQRHGHSELPDDLAAPQADDAEQAHRELAQCLVPLIDELPERYRLPLQLAELQGLSQQQVADHLGLSLSGAKSRVQRGRQQLRQRLTACCNIEVGRGGVLDYHPKDPDCRGC